MHAWAKVRLRILLRLKGTKQKKQRVKTYLYGWTSQEPGETLDQFLAKLPAKAVNCKFGDVRTWNQNHRLSRKPTYLP